jgi:hypothetical protein
MRRNIYVLGNPCLKQDALPIKLLPKIQKLFPDISFIYLDPTEECPYVSNKEFIFIDTVVGIEKVTKFSGLNHWTISPRNTVHDFDLPLNLGILKKLGKIEKITIIGVPQEGNERRILNDLRDILTRI